MNEAHCEYLVCPPPPPCKIPLYIPVKLNKNLCHHLKGFRSDLSGYLSLLAGGGLPRFYFSTAAPLSKTHLDSLSMRMANCNLLLFAE